MGCEGEKVVVFSPSLPSTDADANLEVPYPGTSACTAKVLNELSSAESDEGVDSDVSDFVLLTRRMCGRTQANPKGIWICTTSDPHAVRC